MTITADQILLDAEVRVRSWWRSSQWKDAGATFYFGDNDAPAALRSHLRKRDRRTTNFRLVLIAVADDAELDSDAAEAAAPGAYAAEADHLRACGFLSDVRVLEALGTDDAFVAWVTRQRSIISGTFSEVDAAGDGRCVACHVRRAESAGTAFKPLFACVPMTNDEHMRQHQGGEFAAWAYFHRINEREMPAHSNDAAKAWFDEQLQAVRARWADQQLCAALSVPALSHAKPLDLFGWTKSRGLTRLLPEPEVTTDEREGAEESNA